MLLASAPARADVIVLQGVNNQGTDNVLLTDVTNVSIVVGTLGTFNVHFESDGGNLNAVASGQARVTPASDNDPFNDIFFYLANATFTRAVFNVNSAVDGQMTLRVNGINIDGAVFEANYAVGATGENFFTVTAINGQLITMITLIGLQDVEFEDLRQVRIGGAAATTTPQGPAPVPEPGMLVLFGTGLLILGYGARRRVRPGMTTLSYCDDERS